jgi:hypothetical protein
MDAAEVWAVVLLCAASAIAGAGLTLMWVVYKIKKEMNW